MKHLIRFAKGLRFLVLMALLFVVAPVVLINVFAAWPIQCCVVAFLGMAYGLGGEL